jgi:hypothetical protein
MRDREVDDREHRPFAPRAVDSLGESSKGGAYDEIGDGQAEARMLAKKMP